MQARRLVGDGDVGAKAPRKRAENTRAETAVGAVGGWRTDGRTAGFRPVEQHAGRNFLQLDLNGAVGSRQGAVLQRIGDQLVQDQGEVLCQLRVERHLRPAVHRVALGEDAHLIVDQVDQCDLAFGVADMPVGIDHRLQPVEQPVLDRGR